MNSSFLPPELQNLFTADTLMRLLWGIAVFIVGILLLKLVVFVVGRSVERRLSAQSAMIVKKVLFYIGLLLVVLIILAQFGVQMNALLGAAGVLGLGIGFAAQTSVSNVISGAFLISEKAFTVGDLITIGDTTGVILSIDLLSVKLRMLDNRFVRVPNENIIKMNVTNITRFPIRRMDIEFTVAHSVDPLKVREIALSVVGLVSASLDEPEPLFLIQQVTPIGVDIRLGVWFPKDQFLVVRNGVLSGLISAFREQGIDFARYPFVKEPTVS